MSITKLLVLQSTSLLTHHSGHSEVQPKLAGLSVRPEQLDDVDSGRRHQEEGDDHAEALEADQPGHQADPWVAGGRPLQEQLDGDDGGHVDEAGDDEDPGHEESVVLVPGTEDAGGGAEHSDELGARV